MRTWVYVDGFNLYYGAVNLSSRALRTLGYRTGDIADTLRVKITSLGPVRAKLIRKGMIYSSAHDDMAFTVPLLDELIVRTMPTLKC